MSNNHKKRGRAIWHSGRLGLVFAFMVLITLGVVLLLIPQDDDEDVVLPPPEIGFAHVQLYFPSLVDGWGQEVRQIEISDESDMITAVMTGLLRGPARPYLERSIPEGILIQSIIFNQASGVLDLSFSQEFDEISVSDRIVLMGSVVWTLTSLDFVESLRFFVDGVPVFGLPDSDLRDRTNTSLAADAPLPPSAVLITLYFPDEMFQWLVSQARSVHLDALIGSPATSGVDMLI
ncbi:MAG: GerMN domain-containing protein, partial [Defluviitaleaceae bacterium]|nr:GerMN domain-containing protein [Defluviitaleaceae bacterium]